MSKYICIRWALFSYHLYSLLAANSVLVTQQHTILGILQHRLYVAIAHEINVNEWIDVKYGIFKRKDHLLICLQKCKKSDKGLIVTQSCTPQRSNVPILANTVLKITSHTLSLIIKTDYRWAFQ